MTRARVLIADDKPNMLKLLTRVLSERFHVTSARDGQHAIDLARSGRFDVVLTDIRMPGADGFSVLSVLRREHPEVEVVLMTAYGSVPKAVEAIKAGAHDYLMKPFEPETVVRVVQNAVDRKRLRAGAEDVSTPAGVAFRLEDRVIQASMGAACDEGILSLSYRDAVDHARDQASRDYLIALMREFGGNVTHAADLAGVERETLHRLLRRYRVRPDAFRVQSETPEDDPHEG